MHFSLSNATTRITLAMFQTNRVQTRCHTCIHLCINNWMCIRCHWEYREIVKAIFCWHYVSTYLRCFYFYLNIQWKYRAMVQCFLFSTVQTNVQRPDITSTCKLNFRITKVFKRLLLFWDTTLFKPDQSFVIYWIGIYKYLYLITISAC